MCRVERNGASAFVGLPEREALKIADLWNRDEIGVELSVEVKAPVVVGVYPMRISRYVLDGNGFHTNGHPSFSVGGGDGRRFNRDDAAAAGEPANHHPLPHSGAPAH
jgi:hypothetical protein